MKYSLASNIVCSLKNNRGHSRDTKPNSTYVLDHYRYPFLLWGKSATHIRCSYIDPLFVELVYWPWLMAITEQITATNLPIPARSLFLFIS